VCCVSACVCVCVTCACACVCARVRHTRLCVVGPLSRLCLALCSTLRGVGRVVDPTFMRMYALAPVCSAHDLCTCNARRLLGDLLHGQVILVAEVGNRPFHRAANPSRRASLIRYHSLNTNGEHVSQCTIEVCMDSRLRLGKRRRSQKSCVSSKVVSHVA
jgi:hypothetical protein